MPSGKEVEVHPLDFGMHVVRRREQATQYGRVPGNAILETDGAPLSLAPGLPHEGQPAPCGSPAHGSGLPPRPEESFQELVKRMTALQVVEQHLEEYARTGKAWSTAENIRIGNDCSLHDCHASRESCSCSSGNLYCFVIRGERRA